MKTNLYSDCETIDNFSAYEMLIRWEIAADHLAEVEADGRLADFAIRTLINRDFPLLMDELKRLRPEMKLGLRAPSEQNAART